MENILDISIFALESSFNGTGDILELAEVAVDLLASIFIDDKNIKAGWRINQRGQLFESYEL